MNPFDSVCLWALAIGIGLIYAIFKYVRSTGKDEPVIGAVFVTGCDSGMGETTAFHLAKIGYHVYAGCYLKESYEKYKDFKNITPLQVDVANEKSVADCAKAVDDHIQASKGAIKGLYGVLQAAGIAYIAPFGKYIRGSQVSLLFFHMLVSLQTLYRVHSHRCIQATDRCQLLRLRVRCQGFSSYCEEVHHYARCTQREILLRQQWSSARPWCPFYYLLYGC